MLEFGKIEEGIGTLTLQIMTVSLNYVIRILYKITSKGAFQIL